MCQTTFYQNYLYDNQRCQLQKTKNPQTAPQKSTEIPRNFFVFKTTAFYQILTFLSNLEWKKQGCGAEFFFSSAPLDPISKIQAKWWFEISKVGNPGCTIDFCQIRSFVKSVVWWVNLPGSRT